MAKKSTKYIFVVGGVMSGVGKGVATSSVAKILQAKGFSVTSVKIDPYVNVDAGTMNPTEHGEVFVLDDGTECDQDLGNYERFLDKTFTKTNYMTTGSVYQSVINRERNLGYHGKCVEVVPHIPLEVIRRIKRAAKESRASIVTSEIGGTVGEYQNILFLEAIRMLKLKNPNDVLLILVSYLPIQNKDSELKTKPTQYAVRTLNSTGLQPDIIIARSAHPLDKKRKEKIAFSCNMREEDIISAPDIESIYDVPINFEKDNLSKNILKKLNLKTKKHDLREWRNLTLKIKNAKKEIKIGIVGKYFDTGDFVLTDSYISVIEAVKHASYSLNLKPVIVWIDSQGFEGNSKRAKEKIKELKKLNGIIVPGGFGGRGIEGKIAAINYCRKNKIPYFGLCYGMQFLIVEFARNVAQFKDAHTTEVNQKTPHPVIDILPEQKENIEAKNYGATMRLGTYKAKLENNTIAREAYGKSSIFERHRHRYEVNPNYIEKLEKKGLIFSGFSSDRRLMEIAELSRESHPFFLGTQFHPEFKSRPLHPHPLFIEFIKEANKRKI